MRRKFPFVEMSQTEQAAAEVPASTLSRGPLIDLSNRQPEPLTGPPERIQRLRSNVLLFPAAQQPDIVRAAGKDKYFESIFYRDTMEVLLRILGKLHNIFLFCFS